MTPKAGVMIHLQTTNNELDNYIKQISIKIKTCIKCFCQTPDGDSYIGLCSIKGGCC